MIPKETPSDVTVPDGAALCEVCSAPLRATRYVHVETWAMYVLCSVGCFRDAVRDRRRVRWAARRQNAGQIALAAILATGFLTPHEGPAVRRPIAHAAPVMRAAPGPTEAKAQARLPPGWYGPEWPPTETSLLAALGHDTWIHPLAGPVRRMPRVDSRVFGAARPGDRPAECRNGHCGVDLGGEIWGEHVHAVHDGVVDFVQRNPNPDRGGEFVRISHRDGTVFSWYFHLAAIPRGLERGSYVKGGDVVGLLGDTGVKASAPHLHFAISVRPAKDWPERYMDPEPLITLWPLRIPVEGSERGLVTTLARPGMPLGSALLSSEHRRLRAAKAAKAKRGGRQAAEPAGDGPAGEDPSGDAEETAKPARAEAPAPEAGGDAPMEPAGDE
jgi:murein DD-endopeptidase MepM/ murein hydrolase activator NlpD